MCCLEVILWNLESSVLSYFIFVWTFNLKKPSICLTWNRFCFSIWHFLVFHLRTWTDWNTARPFSSLTRASLIIHAKIISIWEQEPFSDLFLKIFCFRTFWNLSFFPPSSMKLPTNIISTTAWPCWVQHTVGNLCWWVSLKQVQTHLHI